MKHKSFNVFNLLAIFFYVLISGIGVANSTDLGEVSINFGTDLVSRTTVKDIGMNDLGYNGGGTAYLATLRDLGDNSLTDGYWSHKNNVIFGFDYMHSLAFSSKIKIGVGTKLIEKKVKVTNTAYLDKNPTPPKHGSDTGHYDVIPTDFYYNILDDYTGYSVSPTPFRELYFLPVYFSVQLNPFSKNSCISGMYLKGNIGCNFIVKDDMPDMDGGYIDSTLWKFKRESGLYFGLEVGNEFGLSEKTFLILSLFYDNIEYRTFQAEDGMAHEHKDSGWFTNVDHIIGIKTGLKFKL